MPMTTSDPPRPKSGRWYALGRTIAARMGAKASNNVTSHGSLRYHGPSVRVAASRSALVSGGDLGSFCSWRALMGMRISRTGPVESQRVAHVRSAREWTVPRCRGAQARKCPGHGRRHDPARRSERDAVPERPGCSERCVLRALGPPSIVSLDGPGRGQSVVEWRRRRVVREESPRSAGFAGGVMGSHSQTDADGGVGRAGIARRIRRRPVQSCRRRTRLELDGERSRNARGCDCDSARCIAKPPLVARRAFSAHRHDGRAFGRRTSRSSAPHDALGRHAERPRCRGV